MVDYAVQANLENVTEAQQYEFKLEHQNIHYLLEKLLLKEDFSSFEAQTLAFAYYMNMISRARLKSSYSALIKHLNAVCRILNDEGCGELYSSIMQQLYEECRCHTLMEVVQQMLKLNYKVSCREIFTCDLIIEFVIIYHSSNIIPPLKLNEMEFIHDALIFQCSYRWHIVFLLVGTFFLLIPTIMLSYPNLLSNCDKNSKSLNFCVLCSSNTCFSIVCLLYTVVFAYYIKNVTNNNVVILLSTFFPFLFGTLLGVFISIINIACRPLSVKFAIVVSIIYFVSSILVWYFSPVC